MIQKVSFRNFKAYRSLDLELEPFTVLVGPNASGKTTLLEGLLLFSEIANNSSALELSGQLDQPRAGLRSYGTSAPVELSIFGDWNGVEGTVKLLADRLSREDWELDNEDTGVASERFDELGEIWRFNISGEWAGERLPTARYSEKLSPILTKALRGYNRVLRATQILRFEPRRLAEPAYSEEAVPKVHGDGTGLAAVLAHLKLGQDDLFNEIELALKQIVPAIRRIRIERAAVEQTALRTLSLDEQRHRISERRTLWGNKIVFDMRGAKGVSASDAGEGTLMVLGLLTVLMGTNKPRLVLLDDIELGLHPVAQGKLVDVLRKIQQRDPGVQIIATSHSPFILNYLDPKEVRMTFLAENGFARCEKLTAHPEFERWKDMMSPGEFWSTVGESWLEKVGGPASHE